VEAGLSLDGFTFGGEIDAASCDDVFKVMNRWDVFVDDGSIDQRS
jgi:hypothetical protein